MMENGLEENNMESELIKMQKAKKKEVNGRMEKE